MKWTKTGELLCASLNDLCFCLSPGLQQIVIDLGQIPVRLSDDPALGLDRLLGGLLESVGDRLRRTGGDRDLDEDTLLVRLLSLPLCLPFILTGGLLDRDGERLLRVGGDRDRDRDRDTEEL